MWQLDHKSRWNGINLIKQRTVIPVSLGEDREPHRPTVEFRTTDISTSNILTNRTKIKPILNVTSNDRIAPKSNR